MTIEDLLYDLLDDGRILRMDSMVNTADSGDYLLDGYLNIVSLPDAPDGYQGIPNWIGTKNNYISDVYWRVG